MIGQVAGSTLDRGCYGRLGRKRQPVQNAILAEEFLTPLGVTQYRLATAIGVPPRRINEIVHGRRGISELNPGLEAPPSRAD
jgi:hypothetical protein